MPTLEAAATQTAHLMVPNMPYVMGTLAMLFVGWLFTHFLQTVTRRVRRGHRLVRQLRVACLCEASAQTVRARSADQPPGPPGPPDPGSARCAQTDQGRPEHPGQRGLARMHKRAASSGAHLVIHCTPGKRTPITQTLNRSEQTP